MATIKDVAKRAGVSIATVSRVMNERGPISAGTQKKVQKAMEDLNYQPNEMARALQKKESHILGLIVPRISFPFFAALAESVEEACQERGYKLMLCKSGDAGQREKEMLRLLAANKVDGILVCSRVGDVSLYTETALPVVSIDREIRGLPFVACDNVAGGKMAASALYQAGSRKPLFLSNHIPSYMAASGRKEGFCTECASLGIPCEVYEISEGELPKEYRFEEFGRFLKNTGEIDGVFVNGDLLAANLLHWLKTEKSSFLSDIPYLGFDGLEESRLLDITTIAQPVSEMGEYAVELLVRKIRGKIVPERSLLPVRLIERSSTSGSQSQAL